MKMRLINLLLFSDKRKNLLLLLAEKPRDIGEIPGLLQTPRVSLLPQIKKLKEEGLIVQKGDTYHLSIIGNMLIKKARPLLDAVSTLEDNEYFWSHIKLDSIPFYLLKRLGDLKGGQLIEPGPARGFDLFPEITSRFTGSSKVMFLFSYFHPQIPSFSLKLAKKDVEIQLVLSRDSFNRFLEDFREPGEKILTREKASIFVHSGTSLEIPALIAISEKALLLGFFNKKGRFEGQYLISFEPRALLWGRELFEYYMGRSQKVSSMEFPGPGPDSQDISEIL